MGGSSIDPVSLLPPTPEMQPVQVRPAEAPQAGNYGLGAGFMGKTGSAAAIAAPILEGWIQGKQIKEQREQQQAQTKLAGSRNLFAMSVEGYRNWLENNPDAKPEEKKARLAAVQQARDAYAGVMEGYVTPEKPTTRGGKAKAGIKKALGAPTPELFAQAAVSAFKNQPLEDLVAPDALRKLQMEKEKVGIEGEKQGIKASEAQTAAEQERIKDLKEQREERQQNVKDQDEWSALRTKQNKTPEDEKRLQVLNDKLDKNDEQLAKNDITRKLMSDQKLTPGEETAARAFGLVQPDQTGMLQDSTGAWYMVKVAADGKVQKTPLGVKGQLPKISTPGYYESISGLAKAYQEATPGLSRQDAMQKAIASFAQAPQPGWVTGNALNSRLNQALSDVWNSHGGDKADQAALANFFDRAKGYFNLREEPLPGQTSGWFHKTTTRGGLTDEQIQQREPQVRAEIAEALTKHAVPPEQVDAIMEAWKPISERLEAPPAGAKGPAMKMFSITGPDGRTIQKQMTDDDAEALRQRNRSLKINEAGGTAGRPSLTPPQGSFGLMGQ